MEDQKIAIHFHIDEFLNFITITFDIALSYSENDVFYAASITKSELPIADGLKKPTLENFGAFSPIVAPRSQNPPPF